MTPEEIEKRAITSLGNFDLNFPKHMNAKDFVFGFTKGFTEGLSEKQKYAEGKVEEYKESLRKKLRVEIMKRSGPEGSDLNTMHTNEMVRQAYKHCIKLIFPKEDK